MAAHARLVTDRTEAEKVLQLLQLRYPELIFLPISMPSFDDIRIFRLTPVVISVLDYSKGFRHAELVTC
ncbi:hypothetical protein PSAC2689_50451 [Paraburkholderia sacchari]